MRRTNPFSQTRFASLEEYARAASIGLMRLSGGGSEMFTKIGEEYYAVPRYCVERARHKQKTVQKLQSFRAGPTPKPDRAAAAEVVGGQEVVHLDSEGKGSIWL